MADDDRKTVCHDTVPFNSFQWARLSREHQKPEHSIEIQRSAHDDTQEILTTVQIPVQGGHFVQEDISVFDADFFQI